MPCCSARCTIRHERGQLAAALADCNEAIRLQPENWRLYAYRVDLYEDLKRYDDALSDYARFISKRPASTWSSAHPAAVKGERGPASK